LAKDKKKKIPKKIAGVKVPKDLRKSAGKLTKLAKDPVVREIALAAVAAGLAAREDTRKKAKKKAAEMGGEASESAGWVAAALGAAALEAGRRVSQVLDENAAKNGGGRSNLSKAIKAAETIAGGIKH
jgi:hypothetical protein